MGIFGKLFKPKPEELEARQEAEKAQLLLQGVRASPISAIGQPPSSRLCHL